MLSLHAILALALVLTPLALALKPTVSRHGHQLTTPPARPHSTEPSTATRSRGGNPPPSPAQQEQPRLFSGRGGSRSLTNLENFSSFGRDFQQVFRENKREQRASDREYDRLFGPESAAQLRSEAGGASSRASPSSKAQQARLLVQQLPAGRVTKLPDIVTQVGGGPTSEGAGRRKRPAVVLT